MQLEMRRNTRIFVIAQRTSAPCLKKLSGSVFSRIIITVVASQCILSNYLVFVSGIYFIMAYNCSLKFWYRKY